MSNKLRSIQISVICVIFSVITIILSIGVKKMPNERTYYVLCEDNCKFEGMTKEQIIAAIAEATGATPTSVDDAFITKIKEMNANAQLKFWIGTTAQFNALATKANNTLYILTDDDTEESIEAALTAFATTLSSYGQTITAFTTKVNEIYDTAKTLKINNVTTNDFVLATDEANGVYNTINHGTYMVRVWKGTIVRTFSFTMEFYGGDTVYSPLLPLSAQTNVMVKAEKITGGDYWQYHLTLVQTDLLECGDYTIHVRKIGDNYPIG